MTHAKITKSRLLEAAIGKMLERYLGEALSAPEIAQKLAELTSMLATEKDPAKRERIAAAIKRGNQQMAGGVVAQESYIPESIKNLVDELVEDTMLKRNQSSLSSSRGPVVVPRPKNPIAPDPGGPMGPKELAGLLSGIEQMQSLEDLSSEDKMHLARAREIMAGVIKGQARKRHNKGE